MLAVSHREVIDTYFTASREFVVIRGCLIDNSMKFSTQPEFHKVREFPANMGPKLLWNWSLDTPAYSVTMFKLSVQNP